MTVFFIGCTFITFVVILIIILIYLQQTSTASNKFNKKVKIARKKIYPIFTKLIKNKKINDIIIEELRSKLKNKASITAFNKIYLSYIENNGNTKRLKEIIAKVMTKDLIFNKKIYKGKYKNDYALYLISHYNIADQDSINFAFKELDSESLYTRNNAIKVIENSNEITNYIDALKIINKSNHYMNEKIILDFLISFKGNKEEFNQLLISNFGKYRNEYKKHIIDYFRIKKYDSESLTKEIINIFENSTDKELIISGIKYFGMVKNNQAIKYINKYLGSDVVEIKSLASKYAFQYSSSVTKNKLKRNLTDSNWYVRNNAASSLVRMDYTEDDVAEILNNKDKFARETFQHALNSEKVI